MNSFLFFLRKLMAWGNPLDLKELNINGKEQGFWGSLGW